MANDLLNSVAESDVTGSAERLKRDLSARVDAWDIHLSLFPVAQRVLNPPFINPHLPKMHAICREFLPYLQGEDIAALVRLEVNEYARRPKLEELPKAGPLRKRISFEEVESAMGEQDSEKTAALLATFHAQNGVAELARRLLLLGSGYLSHSLGHSVSCTAFILLEMLARTDQDPWPAVAALADYFCKGRFHARPSLSKSTAISSDQAFRRQLLRAISGRGVVNLHHTITLYAVERARLFFKDQEHNHMLGAWVSFMEDKEAKHVAVDLPSVPRPTGYPPFYETFSKLESEPVLAIAKQMIGSERGRLPLGRYLIKGVCDQYQGDYEPHYLTGLGSTLWVLDRFWNQPAVAAGALLQYLDYFFSGIQRRG